jgi:hypothetical protein
LKDGMQIKLVAVVSGGAPRPLGEGLGVRV